MANQNPTSYTIKPQQTIINYYDIHLYRTNRRLLIRRLFLTGFQEANMMPSNEAEATLTQLIRTRLKSDALRLIRNVAYEKIEDLLKTF